MRSVQETFEQLGLSPPLEENSIVRVLRSRCRNPVLSGALLVFLFETALVYGLKSAALSNSLKPYNAD
jgi:hypothetical protein